MSIDLTTAQTHLSKWLEADLKVAEGQTVKMGDRELTMADARHITKQVTLWQGRVRNLQKKMRMVSKKVRLV